MSVPPPDPAGMKVRDYLIRLKTRGVRVGLERIERLMAALGHPERNVPCVHVAGTNGKGSVAAMLEAIFRAAGWRTGLYTSPHLVKLGERIQVNRQHLGDNELELYTRELQPVAADVAGRDSAEGHPSYFEFMTALAFLHFARSRCDVAIIETGLGGRLDATNVVMPEASVITSIGLDHCDLLGDSLEQIAAEKAGIIKPGVPIVLGRLPAAAEAIIRAISAQRGARLLRVVDEFGTDVAGYPRTNLEGNYQRWNAATATLTAQVMGERWRLNGPLMSKALSNVAWPGRWERTTVGGRLLILDASHNADGAETLDANLAELTRETGRAPVVIIGVLGAARAGPIVGAICRHARKLHLVVPNQARACTHAQLAGLIPEWYRGRVEWSMVEDIFPYPSVCTAGELNDPLVVTGSIYLLGEVIVRFDPSRGPLESSLQDF